MENIREIIETLVREEPPDREMLEKTALLYFVAEKMGEYGVCNITRMIIEEALKKPERLIIQ